MRFRSRTAGRAGTTFTAVLVTMCMVVAACGGESSDETERDEGESGLEAQGLTVEAGESGLDEAGDPVRGGTLTYGLEADTNGGFCLSEGQLAISGMMVVRAIYDTLTVPNADGDFVPYLAESVEPNDDFTEWTITVRDGVSFHDGSPLTAEVVKNNLDAYRGTYEGRSSLLFAFVLQNVSETEVLDERSLVVRTDVPWVAFPAYLYSSSRLGIMAQSQLDDDNCATNPVGTGPFSFVEWRENERFVGERNEDYWQIAPDGEPYPYLDRIVFEPIPDGQVRGQAIESGNVDAIHTSNAADIGNRFRNMVEDGDANMLVSEAFAEVGFVQMNQTQPPFDDLRMRRALAMGADREQINMVISDGLPTIASGIFAPDSPAYLEDTGFPEFDLEGARALVDEYRAEGNDPSFTLTATPDPTVRRQAELLQERAQALGVTVNLEQLDQAALINAAIGKNYQAMLFRNYPGGDPDQSYVWFYSTTGENGSPNLVNFAGIDDPEVDRLLDEGRSEPDPDARQEIYQDLNRRMGEQVHGLWFSYTPWAVVLGANVHNVLGPPLPGQDPGEPGDASTDDSARQPNSGLATGHSLLGMWIAQ